MDLGDGYDETDTFIDNTEAVCIMLLHLHHSLHCVKYCTSFVVKMWLDHWHV